MSDHLERLQADHTPEAVERRLGAATSHSYLRDFIYGAIDGAVTTFAVVCSVEGAGLATGIIVILGFANLVGDGFSMAVGNFMGTRAEDQVRARARLTEERHIDLVPDGEREEVRQILAAQGFPDDVVERATEAITADRRRWVDLMLKEELGLPLDGPSPTRAALMTFVAFISVGMIPLLAFLVELPWPDLLASPFTWSVGLTGLAFFAVGAIKSRFVEQRWWFSGLETLGAGTLAAGLAYGIGAALKGLA